MFSLVQEINYDSARGGVSVITEKGDVTTSYLLIQKAKTSDSGKYACAPTNAKPVSISVHVLNGNLIQSSEKSFKSMLSCLMPSEVTFVQSTCAILVHCSRSKQRPCMSGNY